MRTVFGQPSHSSPAAASRWAGMVRFCSGRHRQAMVMSVASSTATLPVSYTTRNTSEYRKISLTLPDGIFLMATVWPVRSENTTSIPDSLTHAISLVLATWCTHMTSIVAWDSRDKSTTRSPYSCRWSGRTSMCESMSLVSSAPSAMTAGLGWCGWKILSSERAARSLMVLSMQCLHTSSATRSATLNRGRSSGFAAQQRWMSSMNGMSCVFGGDGRSCLARMSSFRRFAWNAWMILPSPPTTSLMYLGDCRNSSNGTMRASTSYVTMPNEYTSDMVSYDSPFSTSGANHWNAISDS
mmetsp:Transcript_15800/g.40431  ORF Transcript_15800/g.40431 Transcript_15800/m.40431 type:complete len:297 (+) Transcript_15800:1214-2104(+)